MSGLAGVLGTPTPVEVTVDDSGIATKTLLTKPSGMTDAAWYVQLANKGITQFRYIADTTPDFAPGKVSITFLGYKSDGSGWRDSAGNKSADKAALDFFVEGPTVNLVSPGANGAIDIGTLQSRGYIDVSFTLPSGYVLDVASITDLAAEFTLTGAGLGSVKLDSGQAPVRLADVGGNPTFRYWISGAFAADASADDTVALEFIPNSVGFTKAGTNPASTTVTLNNSQWITVNFDNVPAGFSLDPGSITDLAAEFDIAYNGQNAAKNGTGSIALVNDVAPQRIGETNTYRFRVSGSFATDGTQSATLTFRSNAWSFTESAAVIQARVDNGNGTLVSEVDASVLKGRSSSYIDIGFTPSVKLGGGTGYTVTAALFSDVIISGAGITGPPPMLNKDATPLGNNVYRYYVDGGAFSVAGDGVVTVKVNANAVRDNSIASPGLGNRETIQTFKLLGTTANVSGPAAGGLIGMAALNNRGFLDVTFGFPSGKTLDLDSIYDLDPEFSIDAATGHSIRLDGTQAPILLGQTGNTYTFRYFTLGSYTSGAVTITLIANAIGFTDGSKQTSTDTLVVANPSTTNISYIDIRYTPVGGAVLDADSITDPEDEFTITGAGRGTVALSSTYGPWRLTNSNTYRYFLTGDFTSGEVTITLLLNSVASVATDTAKVIDADGVGNLVSSEKFTVVVLTAALADPVQGGSVDADLLNNRGYFDVDFDALRVAGGFSAIDVASITDLDPELEVVGTPAGGTFALDNSQAPVRIGDTGYTFRFWYTGTFKTGTLNFKVIAGSFSYLDAANATTANAVATLAPVVLTDANNSTWIDVRFTTAGGVALDETSFADAAREFALSGSGLGTATLLAGAPTRLSSSNDKIDNNGDGRVDEADENVFRFYVARGEHGFAAGSVSVTFTGANWADKDGNRGENATQAFQVIETLKPDNGQSGTGVGKVFYIEISGGIKLQGLGFTDEPIVDIRGGVTLEISQSRHQSVCVCSCLRP